MNVFSQLAKHPVFTIDEVEKLTGNLKTAYSQLERLMKKGLVKKIRKNIYSAVNPATGQLVREPGRIAF